MEGWAVGTGGAIVQVPTLPYPYRTRTRTPNP